MSSMSSSLQQTHINQHNSVNSHLRHLSGTYTSSRSITLIATSRWSSLSQLHVIHSLSANLFSSLMYVSINALMICSYPLYTSPKEPLPIMSSLSYRFACSCRASVMDRVLNQPFQAWTGGPQCYGQGLAGWDRHSHMYDESSLAGLQKGSDHPARWRAKQPFSNNTLQKPLRKRTAVAVCVAKMKT